MGSHKGWDRHFITIEGLTMKSGRSLQLAKGQFGVVDMESAPNRQGLLVTSTFTGLKNRKFEMRLGVAPIQPSRSQSDKALSTPVFKLSEIVDLKVAAPKVKGIKTDHFIIGYDGIHEDSAIKLQNGDNEVIDIGLEGQSIGMLGFKNGKTVVKLYLNAPNTGSFTDQEIVEKAVEEFNRKTLIGGVPITNYVEATPTNSLNSTLTGTAYKYFTLNVPDNGDYTSLALVQAQYPLFKVERVEYLAEMSKYTILAPENTVLDDYEVTGGAIIKNCQNCPSGYTQDGDLCVSTVDLTYEWEAGDSCYAQTETYNITLADDECGNNRLAELQEAYPELTITVVDSGTPSGNSKRSVTLSGSSGTANITIGGTDYLATYTTSQTVTAQNFVTAHAAAINTATGGTLTSSGNVITLTDATTGFPAMLIANVSGNLNGTVGALTAINSPVAGGCMTSYTTTVMTNVICEDCSPLYNGLFTSEAPVPFDSINWEKAVKTYDPDALMGISFKAKQTIVAGDETYRDQVGFIASSVRLTIAGGYPQTISESFKEGSSSGRFKVKLISRAEEPESWGGMFYDWEDRSNVHFAGRKRFDDNNYGNWILGQESHLKPTSQYVDYVLSIRTVRMSQSFSGEVIENFNFHILAEVGRHKDVEDILNAMATEVGIPTVQAYS